MENYIKKEHSLDVEVGGIHGIAQTVKLFGHTCTYVEYNEYIITSIGLAMCIKRSLCLRSIKNKKLKRD